MLTPKLPSTVDRCGDSVTHHKEKANISAIRKSLTVNIIAHHLWLIRTQSEVLTI